MINANERYISDIVALHTVVLPVERADVNRRGNYDSEVLGKCIFYRAKQSNEFN